MNPNITLIKLLKRCFSQDKFSLNYHGVFNDVFTEQLISLADCDVEKKAKKKVALLISESFQNIVRHGESAFACEESSLFGIRGIDQFLHIFSTNPVTNSTKLFLDQKLDEINKMDKDQIKVLYAESLENGVISAKGGAGLGLIEMARKSERPIQKGFKKLNDDQYSFYMQVDLLVNDKQQHDVEPIPISINDNKEIYELIADHNIVFLYKGDFSASIMNPILSIMRQNTEGTGNALGFKIFHTIVELMQNIVRHGKEIDGKKEGVFTLSRTGKGFYICTGNHLKGDTKEITEFLTDLNSQEKNVLDQTYRSVLKKNVFNEGDSAGVGLIDLRRSLMTKFDFECGVDEKGKYVMIGIEIPIK